MAFPLTPLNPRDAAEMLRSGAAVLIDVREADEFARAHAAGARSRPLSRFDAGGPTPAPGQATIFSCRSGARTAAHCDRLAASVAGAAYVLDGGLDSWEKAGLAVVKDAAAPLELMRQVQIAAGSLTLLGVALGFLVHPGFFGLSAFVGAGLTLAGATGFCGMARLLAVMPWNRARRA